MASRGLMIFSGIVLILGGVLALILPGLASLTATLIVGWTLVASGILHLVEAFRQAEDRLWNALFGALSILLGLSFLFNPLGGMLSLAIVLGGLFFALGAAQLYLAWKRRNRGSVWMLALSGAVSVAVALLIAFNIFAAAVTVPGLVLAIELITTGLALLMLRPSELSTSTGTGTSGPTTTTTA